MAGCFTRTDGQLLGHRTLWIPQGAEPPRPLTRMTGAWGQPVASCCHHILPETGSSCPSPEGALLPVPALVVCVAKDHRSLPREDQESHPVSPVKWPKMTLTHQRDKSRLGLGQAAATGPRDPLAVLSARPHTVSMDLIVDKIQRSQTTPSQPLVATANICALGNLWPSPLPRPSWHPVHCHAGTGALPFSLGTLPGPWFFASCSLPHVTLPSLPSPSLSSVFGEQNAIC